MRELSYTLVMMGMIIHSLSIEGQPEKHFTKQSSDLCQSRRKNDEKRYDSLRRFIWLSSGFKTHVKSRKKQTSDIFAKDPLFFSEAMPLLWREFQSELGVSETSTWSAQRLGVWWTQHKVGPKTPVITPITRVSYFIPGKPIDLKGHL